MIIGYSIIIVQDNHLNVTTCREKTERTVTSRRKLRLFVKCLTFRSLDGPSLWQSEGLRDLFLSRSIFASAWISTYTVKTLPENFSRLRPWPLTGVHWFVKSHIRQSDRRVNTICVCFLFCCIHINAYVHVYKTSRTVIPTVFFSQVSYSRVVTSSCVDLYNRVIAINKT